MDQGDELTGGASGGRSCGPAAAPRPQLDEAPPGALAPPEPLSRSASSAQTVPEAGEVVVWVDPSTRQPYGVVRIPGATTPPLPPGRAAGGQPPPSQRFSDDDGGGGGDGSDDDGATYVFTRLDTLAPGFQKGSCWLEVHVQVNA